MIGRISVMCFKGIAVVARCHVRYGRHQENPKKTYLPLLTYCLNALDQVH
jgi:hypothetical protein